MPAPGKVSHAVAQPGTACRKRMIRARIAERARAVGQDLQRAMASAMPGPRSDGVAAVAALDVGDCVRKVDRHTLPASLVRDGIANLCSLQPDRSLMRDRHGSGGEQGIEPGAVSAFAESQVAGTEHHERH